MSYRTGALGCMILVAAMSRLVPHPPNFTPIMAMALFGGATLSQKWVAFLLPLLAMLISDAALELTTRLGLLSGWLAEGYGFHWGMAVVYSIFALITAIGLLLRKRRTIVTVSAATLAASVLFYSLANFAVWADGTLYPRTVEGLWFCYVAALPFFQWTLLGNACYAVALFGGLALAERLVPRLVCGSAAPSRLANASA
jgi:hypothetical protein